MGGQLRSYGALGLLTLGALLVTTGCGDSGAAAGSGGGWRTKFHGSTPWNKASHQPGGSKLALIYTTMIGPTDRVRDRLDRADVAEEGDHVRIRLVQTVQYREGVTVASQSVKVRVELPLSKPLGNRKLVHEPVTKGPFELDPEDTKDSPYELKGVGHGLSG